MNKYYKAIISANFQDRHAYYACDLEIKSTVSEKDDPIESIGDTEDADHAKTIQLLKEKIRELQLRLLQQNHATRLVFLLHIIDQFSGAL